jgi:hypothetical protein
MLGPGCHGPQGHAAHRVNEELLPALAAAGGAVDLDRLRHVAKAPQAQRLELDRLHSLGRLEGCFGQQHLRTAGLGGHARRQVDGGAEPASLPLHGGTGVHPDADLGEVRRVRGPLDHAETELDGAGGIIEAQHQGVPNRLCLAAAKAGQPRAHRARELADQVGGSLVTVDLGQCREAGQIREGERVLGRSQPLVQGSVSDVVSEYACPESGAG